MLKLLRPFIGILSIIFLSMVFTGNTVYANNKQKDLNPEAQQEIDELSKNALNDKKVRDKISSEIEKNGGLEKAKKINKTNPADYPNLSESDKKLYQLSNILVSKEIKLESKKNINLTRRGESDKQNNYGCWYTDGWMIYRNVWGLPGIKFVLTTSSCGDNTYMYSGSVLSTRGEIYMPAWGYYGLAGNGWDSLTKSEFVAFRQGVFKSCLSTNWACPQELRPWVEVHANPLNRLDIFYAA